MEWNYKKEDFATSAPYEALYKYKDNPFVHATKMASLAEYASSVQFRGFKTMYRSYIESLKASSSTVYVDNVTSFTGQPLELNAGDWEAKDFGIYKKSGFSEEVACPHPIMPVERYTNIDTGEEKLKLAYRKGVSWRKIVVDKSVLASATKVTDLARVGIAVTSQNARSFIQYVSDMENLNYDIIPEKKSIGRLGYIEGEGFSPYVDNLIFDGDQNFSSLFNSVSQKGNFEAWKQTAKEVRNMSITAKILLAASFSSPLLEPVNSLPFFVHLWGGESGTGKTVGLMVAASIWGDPSVGNYIKTFNSTVVGMEKTAEFLNHLPLCLDELQLAKDNHGRTNFDVYKLAQGVGRTRSNKSGGVEITPTWHNCILTTGESPLTADSSGAGAINRVIDIECKPEHPVIQDGMKVSNVVKRNYGFAGREFVRRLYEDSDRLQRIIERYQGLFKELSDHDTTEKQAMAAAAIVLGDELACDWIFDGTEKPLTTSDISAFLASKAAVSIGDRAYKFLCDWISQNGHKLCQKSEQSDVYGAIDDEYAYIIRNIFEHVLADNGFSTAAVISWLKSKNLLWKRGRNNTRAKRINGVPTECYCIKLPKMDDDDEEEDFI